MQLNLKSMKGAYPEIFWGVIKVYLGGIKLQYSCSIAVLTSFLPHKKFTWTDFWGIYTHILPRRYAPGTMTWHSRLWH